MTERCADLDEFFDGELAADQAERFRDHLVTCERCQDVLHGRMQESMTVRVPAVGLASATAVAGPAPPARTAVPPAPADPRTWHRLGRFAIYAAPILAAAAAVAVWLTPSPAPEFQLVVAFDRTEPIQRSRERAGVTQRALPAHVGDVVRSSVHGKRYQAIWVYRDDRELVIACPKDGGSCSTTDGDLTLQLRLHAQGTYTIVGLGSSEPIPEARGTVDETLVFIRSAGVHSERRDIRVD
ncbi:MAG TPA: zf-HC2 domain-containing protein [Kofleriaceae bacterium]|jgi:hypothetical protein|nr:zf-HC2 domain-containing protein [Kofleriaceae bacterium]